MNTTSTAAETYNYTIPPRISRKSRLIALLLAWFLGPLGGHRFYIGKTGTAIVMILSTLSVVGLLVSIPWTFIDFIMIAAGAFRDKEGLLIKSWEARQQVCASSSSEV
jgi:TM2 domain-containing membrane protein YozV